MTLASSQARPDALPAPRHPAEVGGWTEQYSQPPICVDAAATVTLPSSQASTDAAAHRQRHPCEVGGWTGTGEPTSNLRQGRCYSDAGRISGEPGWPSTAPQPPGRIARSGTTMTPTSREDVRDTTQGRPKLDVGDHHTSDVQRGRPPRPDDQAVGRRWRSGATRAPTSNLQSQARDAGVACHVDQPYGEHSDDPAAMGIDVGFTGNGPPIECYHTRRAAPSG